MALTLDNVESDIDVSDDAHEAEEVKSRARLRVAELLQRPFDVRSIGLTGLFILAVFYTIYFMRSVLLPLVLAFLLGYLLRPIVRGLARLRIPLSVKRGSSLSVFLGSSAMEFLRLPRPRRAGCKSAGRFYRTTTKALAGKKIGSASHAGDRGNREAGLQLMRKPRLLK